LVSALQGKKVLITGAANGIGKATALAFMQAGARVIGLDISDGGGSVSIIRCNLARESAIVETVAKAAGQLAGIDILVNNAGVMQDAGIGTITAAQIDQIFSVNVRGTILVTREALPHFADSARIVNIASELAYLGRAGASVYCASKAAILGLTRSWARELAPRILVNAVAPGPTDTALLGFDQMTAAEQALETALPLGRIGRPEEIAAAVLFLAGPGATYFTGQCLGANGGAIMV
jgi:3-oxoacyl-[acyl-carrier protein] reductase